MVFWRGAGLVLAAVLSFLAFSPLAAAQNPIADENELPGVAPEIWDIEGAGDPSIQGFATELSVDQGETVHFKVDTPSSDYRLDLYRLGYYDGLGARLITTLQPSATLPQPQPDCMSDSATGLIDCGNWSESASWPVPETATSGIYLAKLVREDGDETGASHIVFVVRDDDGDSDILVQTSDTTWQAYNTYGGNSLYTGSPAGRAYKVSYNRPFTSRCCFYPGGSILSFLFSAEYPMLRWLERNGYDVSYSTGIDTDRSGGELLEHDVFLSVGHDEYWSAGQRANVEAARAAGVHLGFFSGNQVFWKTRWEPSIDGSGTPHRTLVSYKETHANAKIDIGNPWTGTWRDPRFSPPPDGGQPENALTGSIFTVNGVQNDAIQVPEADGKLRFWRNTPVAALGAGQVATLPTGTLGFEWDEDLDNGFRPPGLMRLSSATVSGKPVLQDYGSTYASGTATHHLVLYRHASGALVFGAGTVQWSWGLDDQHDNPGTPVDASMQQATVNLFADMGVQPATPQIGLVPATISTDASAPSSTITSPADGATISGAINVAGTASDAGGEVGGVEVSVDGGSTWHPATGRASWSYSFTPAAAGPVAIRARAVDDSGNLETPGAGVDVTAGEPACPCSLWDDSVEPSVASANDTQPVELGVKFRASRDGLITALRFYKGAQNTGTHIGHLWSGDGSAMLAEATFSNETASGWQEVALAAPVPVTANTTYVASYHTTVGYYAFNGGYFAAEHASPPLTALASSVPGGNGVYRYGGPAFPTETFNSGNYWVDVVFEDGPPAPTVYRVYDDSDVPPVPAFADGNPVEVGVKFQSSVAGEIRGLRFYKGAANGGTHVGHLWSSAGAQLAEATFTNETAEGWQEVTLASPVPIAADTTYVASYFSPNGFYAFGAGGLDSAVEAPPLILLSNGEAGGNAVYLYGGGFPSQSGNGSNYFVDVVFAPAPPPDLTPPTVTAVSPTSGATNVPVNADVSATFSEAIDEASLTGATFELRNGANTLIAAALSYSAATRTATLDPAAALEFSTTYNVRVVGGAEGVLDAAGNPLAEDVVWLFTTHDPPPPGPEVGPGGPILLVISGANPFSGYYAEILRTEGLNAFETIDIANVDAGALDAHELVVLGEMPLTPAQVTLLSDWVTDGGKLIAMRPDAQLAPLLGLSDTAGELADAYLAIDGASGPGVGLVTDTLQFHGSADLYANVSASQLAALYLTSSTPAAFPAVTRRSVGVAGGWAAAFTYDLARSVVLTRQGNPAWAGTERDGVTPIRSDDLFYGAAAGDPQADWVDLNKVAIPQADEQQRLFAKLVRELLGHPFPSFWYFPSFRKAVVVMTGDEHGCCGGTVARWEQFLAADPASCSVEDWECVRASSYIYPGGGADTIDEQSYTAQGFELGVHVNTGCNDWTPASLEGFYSSQLASFAAPTQFPSIPQQDSSRTHCIAWSDWVSQPEVELAHNIRLDTNYYYWPPGWVADRPGFFTGSGMPMRFARTDGSFVDVYQAVTQMTDESGQTYPFTIDRLLDRALGAEGYYGAFTANMHTDAGNTAASTWAGNIVASAQARGVAVVSGRQMLEWIDGRNSSSFDVVSWDGEELDFSIDQAQGARNLRALLPMSDGTRQLASLLHFGSPLAYTVETVKGVDYAVFAAETGPYLATYLADETPPVLSDLQVLGYSAGAAQVTWNSDEPSSSAVVYGTNPASLTEFASAPGLATAHAVTIGGLAPATTYYYRVSSSDAAGNAATEPPLGEDPASFATPCLADSTASDFSAGTTNGTVTGADVSLAPAIDEPFAGGPQLPPGWTAAPWTGGNAQVAGGELVVDGARAGPGTLYPPGATLEFTARFRNDTYQHVGFATDFDVQPWAIVGTGGTLGNLKARTFLAGSLTETDLGIAPGDPHLFRIEWRPSEIAYYVDGVLKATHLVAIGSEMQVYASDYNNNGTLLYVAHLRLGPPFVPSGTFLSRVADAGHVALWGNTVVTSTGPAGTTLAYSVRTGPTPVPDASWTPFGTSNGQVGRYAQYFAELSTSDPGATPRLTGAAIECVYTTLCGDGVREGAEQCDDGNVAAGDGCSPTCVYESPDADGDEIPNGDETDTGVYVSPTDTGTDPLDPDSDDDGLGDGAEISAGVNPNLPDSDYDGFCDGSLAPIPCLPGDNCPAIANSQANADGDAYGDACDVCALDPFDDSDGDGLCADVDNCPATANGGQANGDGDAFGDACDACPADALNDADLDTVCGDLDNCPATANSDQANGDGDPLGDACDACPADAANDADLDTVCGDLDNCPELANTDQSNGDGDGLGDACDACPADAANDADLDTVCGDLDNCPSVANTDQANGDADAVGDVCDNCPVFANQDQANGDGDAFGDACDACPADAANDADLDTVCGDLDNCPELANVGQEDADADLVGDACDNCEFAPNADQSDTGSVFGTYTAGIGDACRCGDVSDAVHAGPDASVNEYDVDEVRLLLAGASEIPANEITERCSVDGVTGACTVLDWVLLARAGALDDPSILTQMCRPAVCVVDPSDLDGDCLVGAADLCLGWPTSAADQTLDTNSDTVPNACQCGDLDRDGDVDPDDEIALGTCIAGTAGHPLCDLSIADLDRDGVIGALDGAEFGDALEAGTLSDLGCTRRLGPVGP